jgi:hypothetical protein
MTLFAFRKAKSHEWTFCDPINFDEKKGEATGLALSKPLA